MADADRLLELARQALEGLPAYSPERPGIVEPAELLGQLLLQDVERMEGGDGDGRADDWVSLKEGVSQDRMLLVHDPEMRHGHKSSSRRFDGHKAAIAVDTDSQLITAVDVLPGTLRTTWERWNWWSRARPAGVPAAETMGDAAYGDGGTRQTFAGAGRSLIARVPGHPNRKHFPKDDFVIYLAAGSCACPSGNVTWTIVPAGKRTDGTGRVHRL